MKGYLGSHSWFCTLFLYLVCIAGWSSLYGEPDRVSFDSLFPKTWYTKATESCAQVWGAFDNLLAQPKISSTDKVIIIDAAVGRLVCAQLSLDLLSSLSDQTVSADEIQYLARIINEVDDRYMKLTRTLETDRAYCVRRVLDDLKKKVAALAESIPSQ